MEALKYKEYQRLKKGIKHELLLNKLGFVFLSLAFLCSLFAKEYQIYCFVMAIGLLIHLVIPYKTKELLRLVESDLDRDPNALTTRARLNNHITD